MRSGFAAIDNGFGFPRVVCLALEERDGAADQAFPVRAKRFQRFFLPLIDALDLAAVYRDGRVLVFLKLCISSRCRVAVAVVPSAVAALTSDQYERLRLLSLFGASGSEKKDTFWSS